METKE